MHTPIIRAATAADARLIADLSRETFLDAFGALNRQEDVDKFMSEQFSVQQLMQQVGINGHIFFLASVGEEIAGYIFLKDGSGPDQPDKDAIEISRLYARKKFIGTGVGRSLMETAINTARGLGRNRLWLGTWERNHHGIGFYEKFGFIKFGEHDFVVGDDVQRDWLMELIINN
ncbi:MAG: GNAT family N-acetyltransferase [Chitinophagaceae bacterium]|nr:GNAT family N-acetyltransferase [Chitinophagaceae bacterium]